MSTLSGVWRLARPWTLTASIMPGLIGTAYATIDHPLHLFRFFAFLMASVFIQSATNMFNEVFDFVRGLDTVDSVGIAGAIVSGRWRARTVMGLGICCTLFATALGWWLASQAGWWIFPVGLGCIAVGYAYSADPHPLAATPWGELAVGIVMGPVMVLLAVFLQIGRLPSGAILASLPVAFLVAAILTANNLRDIAEDTRAGRRTLVIVLGYERGRQFWLGLMGAALLSTLIFLLATGRWTAALGLIALSYGIQAHHAFLHQNGRGGMRFTALAHSRFGLWFSLGLLLAHFGL